MSLAKVSQEPPSTTSMVPVTKEANGLARKRAQWATSVLFPSLCRGLARAFSCTLARGPAGKAPKAQAL